MCEAGDMHCSPTPPSREMDVLLSHFIVGETEAQQPARRSQGGRNRTAGGQGGPTRDKGRSGPRQQVLRDQRGGRSQG